MASESGGDLRSQQFAETSPTDYLGGGPATTPPDPVKDDGLSCAASAWVARRRLRAEGAETAPQQG